MKYANIHQFSISDGVGIRVSLFVQGCDFMCPGCFNQETWDWNGGKTFTKKDMNFLMELCGKPYIRGLSLIGGEPLHPNNIETVTQIAKTFKELYPQKDIWLWTGYTFEDYVKDKEITKYADVIVDGRFVDELKDLSLKFRGSSNQRIWRKNENNEWKIEE